jgi:hypothetical protein
MHPKLVLIFIMSVALVGAAATTTPTPVLVAMGFLVFVAFLAALGQKQQG